MEVLARYANEEQQERWEGQDQEKEVDDDNDGRSLKVLMMIG